VHKILTFLYLMLIFDKYGLSRVLLREGSFEGSDSIMDTEEVG